MAKAKRLPSGNWRVQVSKNINGKTVRKSFTHKDKRTAELNAAQWAAEQDYFLSEDILLADAFERYIASKEHVLSPSTVRGYKGIAKNQFEDIMNIRLSRLSPEILQKAVNNISASHSPKTVRNAVGLLSATLTMFNPNYKLNITLPQKEKPELYVPSDSDIKNLLAAATGTKLYVPILLAAFGGMRCGEICALTDKDITGKGVSVSKSLVYTPEREWEIKPPKTFSSTRVVELPKFVMDEIKPIKGKITPYNPALLSKNFGKLLKKENLPHFRFHDLRHYFVSSLHSLNIPDKYIMKQGGWSTNHVMQAVYNHTMKEKESAFLSRAADHFSQICG